MKNIIIASVLILLGLQVKAQTEKGTKTLGLNAQLTHTSYTDFNYVNNSTLQTNKSTTFSVGPNFSYFISDGLDLGANIGYNYSNTDNNYNYTQNRVYNSASASIYARKYFMYQNKVGIRTGPFAYYSFGDEKETNSGVNSVNNTDSKVNEYHLGANLDLVYYPSKSLGISATLANISYSHAKRDDNKFNREELDNMNLSLISNALAFSVFYVFGGK